MQGIKKNIVNIPYNDNIDWLFIFSFTTILSKKTIEHTLIEVCSIIVVSKFLFVLMYSHDETKENSITKIRYIKKTGTPNKIFKCHIPQNIPIKRLLVNREYFFRSCGSIKPLQPNSSPQLPIIMKKNNVP